MPSKCSPVLSTADTCVDISKWNVCRQVLMAHDLSPRYLMSVTTVDQRKVLTVLVSPLSELVLITERHLQLTSDSHISYTDFLPPPNVHSKWDSKILTINWRLINPYPTAFPYGNGMVLHFYKQQESSTTKTVHKVINKGLKTYV